MSVVLVTGGSGTLGTHLVAALRGRDHDVRVLSRRPEIAAGSVPHTILRATQFHELIAWALHAVGRLPVAPLPLEWRFQSVAAAEAAARAVELLDGDPLGRAPDFGGPEVLTAREILAAWRERHARPSRVLNLRLPGKVSRGFREGRNTCPDQRDGRQTWAEFVRAMP